MISLEYKTRQKGDNPDVLRKQKFIPSVIYGPKQKPVNISVPMVSFNKAFETGGESTVISLKGEDGSFDALIHDIAYHPVSGMPIHADFYVFEKGKEIEVSVALDFIGVSSAVKDLGGNLVKVLHELKIKASPENLPHDIKIDISSINTFEDHILAKDIVLPKGVSLVEDPNEVICSVEAPKTEEEEVSAPIDLSSIEVAKKGKKEEEEIPEA